MKTKLLALRFLAVITAISGAIVSVNAMLPPNGHIRYQTASITTYCTTVNIPCTTAGTTQCVISVTGTVGLNGNYLGLDHTSCVAVVQRTQPGPPVFKLLPPDVIQVLNPRP